MVNWFRRSRKRIDAPRIRPRKPAGAATRVDLVELTPDVPSFLGRAAYLQLMIFENLGRAVTTAPTTEAKARLTRAAALSLAKHHGLTAEIERHGWTVAETMKPATADIDRFQRVTQGADWFENLTTCYVTAGFLDDFFLRLAGGLSGATSTHVIAVMTLPSGEKLLAEELLTGIANDPRLAARLALWGRRLVGDTILVARSGLGASDNHDSDEARIEPVFTELIAAHTRRLDALGLTA